MQRLFPQIHLESGDFGDFCDVGDFGEDLGAVAEDNDDCHH